MELCFKVKPEDQGIVLDPLTEAVTLLAGTLLDHRSPALPSPAPPPAPPRRNLNLKGATGWTRLRAARPKGRERETGRQQNPGKRTGPAASPGQGGTSPAASKAPMPALENEGCLTCAVSSFASYSGLRSISTFFCPWRKHLRNLKTERRERWRGLLLWGWMGGVSPPAPRNTSGCHPQALSDLSRIGAFVGRISFDRISLPGGAP